MTVEHVTLKDKEITLIGTAHVSKQSVHLVEETIAEIQPEVVGIELDGQRFHQLQQGKKWRETDVASIVKGGKTYLFLINVLLSNMQRRLGVKLGVAPGSEMLAAAESAKEHGIPIALLDRDISITMKRAFAYMGIVEKFKILFSVVTGLFSAKEEITPETIEALKKEDMMTKLMVELGKTAPTIKKVLVDERDQYIAGRITALKSQKIIAVVGAGHLKGIKQYLGKRIHFKELETIPKKFPLWKYILFLIPLTFLAVLVYVVLTQGISMGLEVVLVWIAVNGVLSGLGVLLARGHILSALTAFIAAPFTSLHPAFAAGWFAAAVETKLSLPQVKDFESLHELNSFGDLSKNKVTKIMLVASFANLGSMIGSFVALPFVLQYVL